MWYFPSHLIPLFIYTAKRLATVARQREFEDADYWRILAAMGAGNSALAEVLAADATLPAANTFRKWKALDPARQAAFLAVVEALPFPKQAQMNLLGERFAALVLAQRSAGRTIDEIAALAGVHRVAVNDCLRRRLPGHQQIVRHKTHCPQGHPYAVRFDADGRRFATCPVCSAARRRAKRQP